MAQHQSPKEASQPSFPQSRRSSTHLRDELLSQIVEEIDADDRQAFHRLCSVSKSWCRVARPRLYSTITCRERDRATRTLLLLRTLIQNPDLRIHVKKIHLDQRYCGPEYGIEYINTDWLWCCHPVIQLPPSPARAER